MKKIITFLLLAIILATTNIPLTQAFNDVSENNKYKSAIQYLESKKIIKGDDFFPNKPITRAEYAMWILKDIGFTAERYKPRTKKRFEDVGVLDKYASYIYKLADIGVIDILDSSNFRPKSSISKKDALAWIFSLDGVPIPKIFEDANFQASDIKADDADAPLVNKALEIGLLSPGRVRIEGSVSRGLAAHFIKNISANSPKVVITVIPGLGNDLTTQPKFEIVSEAWRRVNQGYLKRNSIDKDKLLYAAIEGMLKELGDKYTEFERPGDNAVIDSLSGQIEGIGAVMQMKEEDIVIISPIIGSPAARAGLQPNDIVKKVNDVSVAGMKLQDVVSKIKGPKGTQVKLTILRGKETKEFSIIRDVIHIVSTEFTRTSDNIAKITLSNFGDQTTEEFQSITNQLIADKPKAIILDMRNNPGGFLTTALQIAGFFITKDEPVTVVRYTNKSIPEKSTGKAELAGIKTVVLVNNGSASASEILAGALQDYGIATIIGEKTYGKGTVQELSDFVDGSTLKMTVAEWLTPKGRSIEHSGISPDILVPLTEEDRKAQRDPQMDRALEEARK